MTISLKSSREIRLMRAAGQVVAEVLDLMRSTVSPGVTTDHLDRVARALIVERGGYPSFLGYDGFPASVCTSVNDEVLHGIPTRRKLKNGDIISVDVGVFLHGYHADAALTLPVGETDDVTRALIRTTEEALRAALPFVHADGHMGDIAHAIQSTIEGANFRVIQEYGGHGVGRDLHEGPHVPNTGEPGTGLRLRAGMTLAIEPMATIGSGDTKVLDDGWTVVTVDGLVATHYEHTVLITPHGPELLTEPGISVI
jgi:methionyl aminopeptidase